jgi:hypothetical protein
MRPRACGACPLSMRGVLIGLVTSTMLKIIVQS